MLLEARADMTRPRPGGSGQMPLHAAVSTGNEVVVDILLDAKADPICAQRQRVVVRRLGARERGVEAEIP